MSPCRRHLLCPDGLVCTALVLRMREIGLVIDLEAWSVVVKGRVGSEVVFACWAVANKAGGCPLCSRMRAFDMSEPGSKEVAKRAAAPTPEDSHIVAESVGLAPHGQSHRCSAPWRQ